MTATGATSAASDDQDVYDADENQGHAAHHRRDAVHGLIPVPVHRR